MEVKVSSATASADSEELRRVKAALCRLLQAEAVLARARLLIEPGDLLLEHLLLGFEVAEARDRMAREVPFDETEFPLLVARCSAEECRSVPDLVKELDPVLTAYREALVTIDQRVRKTRAEVLAAQSVLDALGAVGVLNT